MELGVKTTINSDDPGVMGISLMTEYNLAYNGLKMSLEQLEKCNLWAADSSFICTEKKAQVFHEKSILTSIALSLLSLASKSTNHYRWRFFTNDESSFDGYTLLAPIPGFETFLINNCGEVVNQWTSDYRVGLSAYLLEDGSLLRTGQLSSQADPAFSGGGTGGRVERFSWDGELVWAIDWADEQNTITTI